MEQGLQRLRIGDDDAGLDLSGAPDRLTIGRGETCDVALPGDERVSRTHAALERVGGEWLITDDGLSRNGTYVNGERLTGRRRLRDGDRILVGDTVLAYAAPGDRLSQATASAAGEGAPDALTPAQRRVLLALCRPYRDSAVASPASNRDIARELVLSTDAVKTTMRQLFDLFAIGDLPQNQKRAALARQALASGAVQRRDL